MSHKKYEIALEVSKEWAKGTKQATLAEYIVEMSNPAPVIVKPDEISATFKRFMKHISHGGDKKFALTAFRGFFAEWLSGVKGLDVLKSSLRRNDIYSGRDMGNIIDELKRDLEA